MFVKRSLSTLPREILQINQSSSLRRFSLHNNSRNADTDRPINQPATTFSRVTLKFHLQAVCMLFACSRRVASPEYSHACTCKELNARDSRARSRRDCVLWHCTYAHTCARAQLHAHSPAMCQQVIRFTGIPRALWSSLACHGNLKTVVPLAA